MSLNLYLQIKYQNLNFQKIDFPPYKKKQTARAATALDGMKKKESLISLSLSTKL